MSGILDKFNLDETLQYIMVMSIAGLILMWFFYTTFPESPNVVLYLVLAILFTVLAPLSFAYLWFRKKKA